MVAFAASTPFTLTRHRSSSICPHASPNSLRSSLFGAQSFTFMKAASKSRAMAMEMEMEVGEEREREDSPAAEETKLFVGNLAWTTTDESLEEAFSKFGTVVEARVIFDRESGRSRGFGFIEYESASSAEDALFGMNGVDVDGRSVRVDRAKSQNQKRRAPGNYY